MSVSSDDAPSNVCLAYSATLCSVLTKFHQQSNLKQRKADAVAIITHWTAACLMFLSKSHALLHRFALSAEWAISREYAIRFIAHIEYHLPKSFPTRQSPIGHEAEIRRIILILLALFDEE